MGRTYAEKRNAAATPEPPFKTAEPTLRALKFVVQRHEASHLHFDFRLECDGVLKSWAVPKGPSLDPSDRRAAIMVEDHPIAYADFEGQIPKGQYGGGEVILWDEGVYAPLGGTGDRKADEAIVRSSLEQGKLEIVLDGHRLRGAFVLVQTKVEKNWLLIKMHDQFESTEDPTRDTDSVRSHLTAEDLRAGREGTDLERGLQSAMVSRASARRRTEVRRTSGLKPAIHHLDLELMIPTERASPFSSELWTFEPKVDGVRALAIKEGAKVRLLTRNQNDIADRFGAVVADLQVLPFESVVLDGEVVLLQADGRPSFQGLMEAYHGNKPPGVLRYCLFDLLEQDGTDYRKRPLAERRARLEMLPLTGTLQLLPSIATEGEHLYAEAIKMGFEGVVAKRLASRYHAGVSDDWLKVKGYHSEEFLIGGFSKGTGARRSTFGALLLGRRDDSGRLLYCGSVGTGFSDHALEEVRHELEGLRVPESPFVGEVPEDKHPIFVQPKLLAEVRFTSWTRDGHLRMPAFLRLRPDRVDSDPPAPQLPTAEGDASLHEILTGSENDLTIEIDGHSIALSNLNKELWPGLTKRDLLRYLASVAEVYLPYLRDRPVSFVRYPDGIGSAGFFQRHWSQRLPEFVENVDLYTNSSGGVRNYILCNNLATLIWLGQISALELHPWHARVDGDGRLSTNFRDNRASALNYPDYLVCDLDPNIRSGKEAVGADPELNDAGWQRTVEVALGLKEILDAVHLNGFLKTSGKTGLHIYVPVVREYRSSQVKDAARTVGEALMKAMPGKVTMEVRLNKRPAAVFFDAAMNGFGRTLASAYSPRPVPGGRISMPITWEQLPTVRPEDFTITSAPGLLAEHSDAWSGLFNRRSRLTA